jgi:hypothetical protein
MMTQTRGDVAALVAAAATMLVRPMPTASGKSAARLSAGTGDGHFAARVRAQSESCADHGLGLSSGRASTAIRHQLDVKT